MKASDRASRGRTICTYSGEIFVATEISGLSTISRVMGYTDRISSSSSSSMSSGSMVGSVFGTFGDMHLRRDTYDADGANFGPKQGSTSSPP
jgi:hypothetical protein